MIKNSKFRISEIFNFKIFYNKSRCGEAIISLLKKNCLFPYVTDLLLMFNYLLCVINIFMKLKFQTESEIL